MQMFSFVKHKQKQIHDAVAQDEIWVCVAEGSNPQLLASPPHLDVIMSHCEWDLLVYTYTHTYTTPSTPTQDRKQQKQPILACHLAECALWSPRVVKMTAYVVEWAPSFFIFLLWLKAMPMIESKAKWVLI